MRKKPEVPGTIGTIVLLIGFKIVIVGHFSAAKSAKSAKIFIQRKTANFLFALLSSYS